MKYRKRIGLGWGQVSLSSRLYGDDDNVVLSVADMINSPPHYNSHPSGIECIQITEHCNFCIGNAIKYLWRSDEKGAPIEDLQKAIWYIQREIARREKSK